MTPLLPDDFVGKCVRHFEHACEKHPKFCNGLLPHDVYAFRNEYKDSECAKAVLNIIRDRLSVATSDKTLLWNDILNCEVWEVTNEMVNGNHAAAIEELYDCIAVCMRAICVVEGKQELTKGVCE